MEKHGIRSSVGYDFRDKVSRLFGIGYGAGVVMIDSKGIVRHKIPKGFSEKAFFDALGTFIKGL